MKFGEAASCVCLPFGSPPFCGIPKGVGSFRKGTEHSFPIQQKKSFAALLISNSTHFQVSEFPIQLAELEMSSKLKMIMPVCLYFVFYFAPPIGTVQNAGIQACSFSVFS